MIIKKFVETKRIKELIVKYLIGKKIWMLTTFGIRAWFWTWSLIKQWIKYGWVNCITVDYRDPAQIKGITTTVVEPTSQIIVSAQADVPIQVSSFAHHKHYNYIVSAIPNGRLMGQSTIATQDNTIIRNLTRRPGQWYASNPRSYMFKPKSVIKRPGTAIVLTGNDTFQNINHRILFGLSKYYLYQKLWLQADWYIIDTQKEFHQQAIKALNIPQDRIITPQTDQVYEFDTLYATNITTIYGLVPQWMSDFIKDLFVPKSIASPNKKIYLKRTGTRRVLNESEFDTYITQQWYEIITTSANTTESVDVELFAQASHVLSPHGAWLTKIIFCQPETKVIELFQPDTLFGHYYAMSKSMNLDYHCFVGTRDTNYHGLDMDAPMIVDILVFDQWIRENKLNL